MVRLKLVVNAEMVEEVLVKTEKTTNIHMEIHTDKSHTVKQWPCASRGVC